MKLAIALSCVCLLAGCVRDATEQVHRAKSPAVAEGPVPVPAEESIHKNALAVEAMSSPAADAMYVKWMREEWKQLLPFIPASFREKWGDDPRVFLMPDMDPTSASARFDSSGEPSITISRGTIIGIYVLCSAIALDEDVVPGTDFARQYFTFHQDRWKRRELFLPESLSMSFLWLGGDLARQHENLAASRTAVCLRYLLAHEVAHLTLGHTRLSDKLTPAEANAERHRRELDADALAVRWLIETENIAVVDQVVDLLLAWAALDGDADSSTHPAHLARARFIKQYKDEVLLLRLQRFRGFDDATRDVLLEKIRRRVAAMSPTMADGPVKEVDLVRVRPTTLPISGQPTTSPSNLQPGEFVDSRAEWARQAINWMLIGYVPREDDNPMTRPDPTTYAFRYEEKYPESDKPGVFRGAANGKWTELHVEIASGARRLDVYPKLERLILAINAAAGDGWDVRGWDNDCVYRAVNAALRFRIEVTSQFDEGRREYVVEFLLRAEAP